MTYLALARKWRPKIFTEVMGQSHVVKALSNALSSGRVHHAFLFTGTRGVGKTTLARIFAKSLNCEQGMSATPCGECSICVNVDQGRFIDLIEVDAASRTGIDDMRELLDNIQYAPTQGRFKVYLIDEIHMLSKSSFNALLKTLEEPPEHIKFLFATTDPQKLPVTVLSRCLQFNLKALQPDEISQQISHILSAEEIAYDDSGVQLIARAADGSLRDALSLLEQAISQGGGEINVESVRAMLGTVKASHMDELLMAIVSNDVESALRTINNMASYAADFKAAINQLLIELHNIALAQIAADALDYKVADVEKYIEYAAKISAEDIQLCYQIALIAKRDIALAPDYRSGFEMALMRIIAFKPVDSIESKQVDSNKHKSTESINSPAQEENSSIEKAVNSSAVTEQAVPAHNTPERTEPRIQQPEGAIEPTMPSVSELGSEVNSEEVAKTIPDTTQSASPGIVHSQSAADSITNMSFEDDNRRAPSKPQVNTAEKQVIEEDVNQAPQLPTDGFNATVTTKPALTLSEQSIPVLDQKRQEKAAGHESQQGHQQGHQQSYAQEAPDLAPPQNNFANELSSQDIPPQHIKPVIDEGDLSNGLPPAAHTEWAGFVEQLQLNGLVRELAMNMACADIQMEPMRLSLDPNFQYMQNPTREEVIVDEIRKLRGTNYQINIVVETTVHETPSERIKRLSEERDRNTLQQLKDDPAVQSVMQAFDMSIDESSVKPK